MSIPESTVKYIIVGNTLTPTREWAHRRGTVITSVAAMAVASRAIRNGARPTDVYTVSDASDRPSITVPMALVRAIGSGKTRSGKAMTRKLALSAELAKAGQAALGKKRIAAIEKKHGF